MPRNLAPIEQNTFVAGLITEASPLTFPANASLDEENFNLNRNGSRTRRYGFDVETNNVVIDAGVEIPSDNNLMITTYKWQDVGGNAGRTFVVVQIANVLHFFDGAAIPLSSGLLATWTYDESAAANKFSYAAVDGMLVVATGMKTIDIFQYVSDTSMTRLTKSLKIRDLFGVTDIAVVNA